MAHHQSAVKRIRTSEKKRTVNRQKRSKMNTLIKSVRTAKNKKEAEAALSEALPYLDKMASINIIHKNKAANQKSKLTKFVNQMS
jgi:small subunit ribosomal protein S20